DLVLGEAAGVERPPPALTADRWVTTFEPLAEASLRRFFSPGVRTRVLVVLSDAETRAFDAGDVLRRLRRAGAEPVVVRFWQPGERIFRRGRPVGSYRAVQPGELMTLRAAGWPAFGENELGAALDRLRPDRSGRLRPGRDVGRRLRRAGRVRAAARAARAAGGDVRLGLLQADAPVRLLRDRLERLVDRPGALLRVRAARLVRVERRVDHAQRVPPVLRRPVLEREAAVRAVVADPLFVPGPVVLVAGDAEVVRRLGPRGGALDDVAPLLAAAGPARVEADHEPVVVLVHLHVAVAAGADEMAPHRLDR